MTPIATACVMLFLCATHLTTGIDAQSQIAAADQQALVNQINSLRSALAKGTVKGSGNCAMSASNSMLKMVWNASLAKAAQSWSDKCVFEHSGQKVGENLHAGATSDPDPVSISSVVIDGVNGWWGELAGWSCPANNVFTSTQNSAGEDVGHFTQLAWANTWQVGCGYKACDGQLEFGSDFPNDYILVCQFLDQGNVLKKSMYTSSAPCAAGTKCSASTTHPTATCGTDGLCTV